MTDPGDELSGDAAQRARARVGRLLRGKWRLDSLLGVGGMAAVYAATHRNGKRAALKMLHPELSVDAGIRGRFLREGRVANAVEHRGAIAVLDDDVAEDGAVFLVMDLLEGETVEARAARSGGRLPAGDVLAIVDQLLDALAVAHDRGIVHRDLKPENLFVTRAGEVKVLDFGIARLREVSSSTTATRSGTTLGTPAFMPPEQARGLANEIDARSDLWAVGATMFTLLTGRHVHQGRTTNEQLVLAITSAAPPIGNIAPAVPPAVAAVVDRALAYANADRWLNARAMQAAVREAYASLHQAPISTAVLTIPEFVVPSVASYETGAPASPTTASPVERAENPFNSSRATRLGAPRIAIGAAVAVAGVVTAFALSQSRLGPTAQALATTAPPPIDSARPSPSEGDAPAPSASSVSVDDLPLASATAPTAAATPIPRRPPAPAGSSASGAKARARTTAVSAVPPVPTTTVDPRDRRR